MKVWIGCMACYNGGDLVGFWIDADEAVDVTEPREAFGAHIRANESGHYPSAHDEEQHEEFWVYDVDDAPHKSLNREMSPMEAGEIAERLAELEDLDLDLEAFGAWIDHTGHEFLKADTGLFEDAYCGVWKDEEDYAYDLAESMGTVPKDHSWPASYIDWDRAARDLFMDMFTEPASVGGIHVFRSY